MQQYFVAGQAQDVVTITDKDTIKHMFNVMRLTENDEVVLVFDDHMKRLAKVIDSAELARELSQIKAGEKILFIFGPEGGISPEEIETFESKGGLKIGLGPRIMRAETAPLYALASVSYALELMK